MLDRISALINSIPKEKLTGLVDEFFQRLQRIRLRPRLAYRFIVGSRAISIEWATDPRHFSEDTGPLLDSQAQTTDALKLWAHSLAGITGQVVTNDPQVRTLLQQVPTPRTRSRDCSIRSNRRCRYCLRT